MGQRPHAPVPQALHALHQQHQHNHRHHHDLVIETLVTIANRLLFVSRRNGLLPLPRLNRGLGAVINLGRSLPFVVMLIALIPLTRLIVGTSGLCPPHPVRFRQCGQRTERPRW